MKVIGAEVFLETFDRVNGNRLERFGLLPLRLETSAVERILLRVQIKPAIGGPVEFFLDLDALRSL
jgi:hypothetical protein